MTAESTISSARTGSYSKTAIAFFCGVDGIFRLPGIFLTVIVIACAAHNGQHCYTYYIYVSSISCHCFQHIQIYTTKTNSIAAHSPNHAESPLH